MKKITYVFAALMFCSSIAFTSCGKGDKAKDAGSDTTEQKASLSPADRIIRLVDKAAAQLLKAETIEDVNKIEQEIGNEVAVLEKKYPNFKPNEEEQKRIVAAIENLQKVGLRRVAELTGSSTDEGVVDTETVEVAK